MRPPGSIAKVVLLIAQTGGDEGVGRWSGDANHPSSSRVDARRTSNRSKRPASRLRQHDAISADSSKSWTCGSQPTWLQLYP